VLLRIILRDDSGELKKYLRGHKIGYTMVEGTREKVKILFSIMKRKDLKPLLASISVHYPNTFFTVDNVRSARKGIFPAPGKAPVHSLFRKHRKSK
jgi:hypothetical protein